MGLSNIEVKKVNRNNILQYMLKADAVSKNRIAEENRLSVPTVAQVLKELEAAGLVKEEGMFDSIGGRKAKSYCCIKDAQLALGIDITTNHVNIVIIDLAMQILYSKRVRFRVHDDKASYQELKEVVKRAVEESLVDSEKILGWGISLPAIIDETGSRIYAKHEQMDISYQFYDIVKDWFSFPVFLENDANSAGKAEILFSRTNEENTVYFSVSQSVGGAIIIGGRVFYGRSCRGGEIGHMTLVPGGKPCYCGRSGCMNTYCSTKILSDIADDDLGKFFEGLERGEKRYTVLWETYLDNLALAVHNISMALDSEIIIGGYLGQYIGAYITPLRERVQKMNPYLTDLSFIKPAALKYESSAIGAAAVFVEKYIAAI